MGGIESQLNGFSEKKSNFAFFLIDLDRLIAKKKVSQFYRLIGRWIEGQFVVRRIGKWVEMKMTYKQIDS